MLALLQKHNHWEDHSLDQVSLYTFQNENKENQRQKILVATVQNPNKELEL